MLFALRINVLAKGFSGITVDTLEMAIKAFNNNCLPLGKIFEKIYDSNSFYEVHLIN